jgi:hypothetical protein
VIGIALFAFAGLLYVVATLRRESQASESGDLHHDDVTTMLTLAAVCVSLCAVTTAAVSMVLQA